MSILTAEHERNEAAFRRLKPTIDGTYPAGTFVAIHGGRIVADAKNLVTLRERLAAEKIPPRESLVVQAGVDYPETMRIGVGFSGSIEANAWKR